MPDLVIAALSEEGSLLVRSGVTTDLCEEARRRHRASPTATAALGRALSGAVLLGSLLKGEQSVLLQWRGDGPLGSVVAEGRADLSVRGYVARPAVDVPSRGGKIDVGGGVGRGELVVVKDYGLKDPYVSKVALQTGEIGDDLAYYLLTSEQIPSAVGLGVHIRADYSVSAAGGIVVEALPGAPQPQVDRVAENFSTLGSVTRILREGVGPEGLAARVLEGVGFRSWPLGSPRFHCTCGPERLEATLVALGPEEAVRILRDEGRIEARCAFCGTHWCKKSLDGHWEVESAPGGG